MERVFGNDSKEGNVPWFDEGSRLFQFYGAEPAVYGAFPGQLAFHQMNSSHADFVLGLKNGPLDKLSERLSFFRADIITHAAQRQVGGKGTRFRRKTQRHQLCLDAFL